jgi:folate-dependent phosphoribosylglycinamide formyltransferase PurN
MLRTDHPLRVGVLCSRRAPGFAELLERSRRGAFEIACCLTSEEDFAERPLARSAGIACISHPVRAHHRARRASLSDRAARASYDAATAKRLATLDLDVIVLSSYLYVLTEPMLAAFPNRIFNVHGSDLQKTGATGHPRYPGLRAVRDAIVAGETETRASLHLVTETLDEGPVLLRSWPFPVSPIAADARAAKSRETLHAYAFAHQEWMLRKAWGRLIAHGLELVAGSPLVLHEGRFRIGPFFGPWELSERGGLLLDSRRQRGGRAGRRALSRAVGE